MIFPLEGADKDGVALDAVPVPLRYQITSEGRSDDHVLFALKKTTSENALVSERKVIFTLLSPLLTASWTNSVTLRSNLVDVTGLPTSISVPRSPLPMPPSKLQFVAELL